MSNPQAGFAPQASATGKTVELAMQRLWLTGHLLPAGARLTVQHVFRSAEDKPLEVIYTFPLPRDAALRRFRISGEGFEVHSELRETEAAVKLYEQGIADGALSSLARQYGDGLISLTVGNIRPRETVTVHLEIVAGVELRDDGFRFRFPFTLAPAYHARAKAAIVAPGEGEMELPAGEFGDIILPRFRDDPSALHQVGFDLSVTSQLEMDELGSPSHAVRIQRDGGQRCRIALGPESDVPNRDLVLDAHFKEVAPQVLAGRLPDGTGRFAAIVPSSAFGVNPNTSRRVVILLDRSGSMQGAPLQQAARAVEACLGTLSETDLFGLLAFDSEVEQFQPELVPGTRKNRDKAHGFLQKVDARGGTELAQGVRAAAKLLAPAGGDVLVLTDGQVEGTEQILDGARASNIRLHCLGIGSASQDRFLALLARETGGVSRFMTPRERVDICAVDLFAAVGRPVASGLKAAGDIQPAPPAAVFSGTPVILFGAAGAGPAEPIDLTWDGGRMSLPVSFSDGPVGESVWLLQGARLITDWESRYPSAEALAPLEKRTQSRIATRLRELSQTYGLASREMSLVAVVLRPGDRPGELPHTRVVPVGMPQDTEFGAYFGASSPLDTQAVAFQQPIRSRRLGSPTKWMARLMGEPVTLFSRAAPEDLLLEIAVRIDSDGGMPGRDPESRAGATLAALFAFLSQGHSATSGAFRSHVQRLMSFLSSLHGLSAARQRLVDAALELARSNRAPDGDWLALASASTNPWKTLQEALHIE